MPSTYAHRRFGADVLVQLPRELREKITPYRPLYDMGLHGPDLMFYYRALQSNPVNRLGNAMHEQPGLCAGVRLPLCTGQHLPPLCGALHPGKRCEPLRDRDGV